METIHWLVVALIMITFLLLLWAILKSSPVLDKMGCALRRTLCGPGRLKFWAALKEAAGSSREVLAWVPMNILIDPLEPKRADALQQWLDSRWLDFVVFDKKYYRPLAVVQFVRREGGEDSMWSQGRDPLLENVLYKAGLPLLWLPSEDYQHVELLKHALEQVLDREEVRLGDTMRV